MKRVLFCIALLSLISPIFADLIVLDNVAQFNQTISQSTVPVIVQFSAYWCNPCQRLKEKMHTVAPTYSDAQVVICYVDAYVNSDLKSYLQGGYPTVRSFFGGQVQSPAFVGDRPEENVRSFINDVVSQFHSRAMVSRENALKELENSEEFRNIIATTNKPVIVQFSAYWCHPCQELKKKMTEIAPTYAEKDITICYVDAYVNSDLKSFLQGGYPTVHAFRNGESQKSFVGNIDATKLKSFIDSVISSGQRGNQLLEPETSDDLKQILKSSSVPVVVQFSAYWCGPCQNLRATFKSVVPSYSEAQIKVVYVDAYENSDLQQYLKEGYPTVRLFKGGELVESVFFVGSKSEAKVRAFLDKVVQGQ